jgi:hypothetical protein
MGAGFGLSRFADQFVAYRARRKQFGLGAKLLRFLGKSFFKRLELYEMATLHDTTSLAFAAPTPQGLRTVHF